MTDKEIEKEAKEYSQGNFYAEQGFLYGYERGFAEGAKEQWHDLRKDPDDLPKESGEYWGYVNYYGFQHRKIYWSDNKFDVSEVIAWCELPKFKRV